jgi:hypothetical protein
MSGFNDSKSEYAPGVVAAEIALGITPTSVSQRRGRRLFHALARGTTDKDYPTVQAAIEGAENGELCGRSYKVCYTFILTLCFVLSSICFYFRASRHKVFSPLTSPFFFAPFITSLM